MPGSPGTRGSDFSPVFSNLLFHKIKRESDSDFLQGEARIEQQCRVSPSLFFEGHLHFTESQTGFRFGVDYEISRRKKLVSQLKENCY